MSGNSVPGPSFGPGTVLLKVETATADQYLTGNVIGEWRAEEEHCACSLRRGSQSSQWTGGFHRLKHRRLHPKPDRVPTHFNVCALAREDLCEASFDQTESHGVDVDVIAAPLLRQCSSEPKHAGFSG